MSRPKRWGKAVSDAEQASADLRQALETLQEIQEEFQEWKDNLPESLEQSPVGEKLDAVCEIGIEDAIGNLDDIDSAIGEAEGADLPLGFGRD